MRVITRESEESLVPARSITTDPLRIIKMIEWIRTSRLAIKNSLSILSESFYATTCGVYKKAKGRIEKMEYLGLAPRVADASPSFLSLQVLEGP